MFHDASMSWPDTPPSARALQLLELPAEPTGDEDERQEVMADLPVLQLPESPEAAGGVHP